MRGWISEFRACCYFASLGYRPLFHRYSIAGVEVDWVSRTHLEYQIWEIKSVREIGGFTARGFHAGQLSRLKRALICWTAAQKTPTSLKLMEVTPSGEYQIIPVDMME